MHDIIKYVINHYKEKYIESKDFNEHWNWYITLKKHNKHLTFKEYININKEITNIVKNSRIITRWIFRRLFINKSIKLLEYYYRPNNPGYYKSFENFNKMLNIQCGIS